MKKAVWVIGLLILAILILIFTVNANATSWKLFYQDKFFYDTESVSTNGNIVSLWTRKNDYYNNTSVYADHYLEINCQAKVMSIIIINYVNFYGDVIHSISITDGQKKWLPMIKNDIYIKQHPLNYMK